MADLAGVSKSFARFNALDESPPRFLLAPPFLGARSSIPGRLGASVFKAVKSRLTLWPTRQCAIEDKRFGHDSCSGETPSLLVEIVSHFFFVWE